MIPAATSPFKAGDAGEVMFSDDRRLMLVRAAFNGVSKVEVDPRGIVRGGVSYAIDTVREIAEANPESEIFFIVGEDSVEGLPRWKDSGELAKLCTFKAYPRTEESSTEIRRRLATRDSLPTHPTTDSATAAST